MENEAAGGRKLTCIVCPRGCALRVKPRPAASGDGGAGSSGGAAWEVAGNRCPRGVDYAVEEMTDPRRVLTTTVRTSDPLFPRLAVKTTAALPLPRLREAARALDGVLARPPVAVGDVLVRDLLGLGADVVATDDLPGGRS